MSTGVLYCGDPLNPRRVDGHFAAEAREVRERGGAVALVDHDALVRGEVDRAVERVPRGFGLAWYRGWMIPDDVYGAFAQALERRGAGLVVGVDGEGTAWPAVDINHGLGKRRLLRTHPAYPLIPSRRAISTPRYAGKKVFAAARSTPFC